MLRTAAGVGALGSGCYLLSDPEKLPAGECEACAIVVVLSERCLACS
jgi:hypothetical protein